MTTMNVAEARRQFSELIARVAYTGRLPPGFDLMMVKGINL
jgi:hypothetical protein